jgi:NAD(P)-dependent dehydrogenase (short-subunit alcohol dehydrogenase family)
MTGFRDRVVVITAAGSGIGRATALAFAREGARLHLVDRRPDRLEQVRAEALTRGSPEAVAHEVDCTDGDAVERLAETVFAAAGRVDVLQNGVGVIVARPVERLRPEDWRWALDQNLWSVVHGVQAFVPRMLAQGGESHLVNIASVAGLVGFPFTAAYSASKAAVVGLSEALCAELHGRGIAVTLVCPGMVRSNLLADGILELPGRWGERLQWVHDHLGPAPEPLAEQILDAVRHRRPLLAPAPGLAGAWYLKRLSAGLYHRLVRRLLRGVVER